MKNVLKKALGKAGRGLLAVVHDKEVQRSGKQAAALALARFLITLGAAPEIVALIQKALS